MFPTKRFFEDVWVSQVGEPAPLAVLHLERGAEPAQILQQFQRCPTVRKLYKGYILEVCNPWGYP
jgi:hypothetical protein